MQDHTPLPETIVRGLLLKKTSSFAALVAVALCLISTLATAQVNLLAVGSLTSSRAGSYTDLSGLNYSLENGVPANLLGGLGSGLAWASGSTFLAVPDRGPNAVSYDSAIDDTSSYVPRFHTINMSLQPNKWYGPAVLGDTDPSPDNAAVQHNSAYLWYWQWTGRWLRSATHQQLFPCTSFLAGPIISIPRAVPAIPATRGSILRAFESRMTASAFSSPTNTVRTFISLMV